MTPSLADADPSSLPETFTKMIPNSFTMTKAKQRAELSVTETKLDAVFAKMGDLLAAKDKLESKLDTILLKLEFGKSQEKTEKDVCELRDSLNFLDHHVTEI